METTPVKVTANDTIISMLAHINADKKDLFYNSVEKYADTLSIKSNYFQRIKRLLREKPLNLMQLRDLPTDVMKLLKRSDFTNENVFLNQDIKKLLDELIVEWSNAEVYKFHNLPIRNKILFHGTTGNGKTTIARHIAKLANLPFIEVNADVVIDSKLGNSGMNIHNIFNKVQEPCVLFWDEIDTIGRKRGIGNDNAAGMENERMVNSILVNMEKLSNEVIFIGATNRREVLDSAFLRRFDIKYELKAPNENQKKTFLNQMVEYYKLPNNYLNIDLSTLNSYSDIKMMLEDSARKYILSNLTK